jgi:hypothetical protein
MTLAASWRLDHNLLSALRDVAVAFDSSNKWAAQRHGRVKEGSRRRWRWRQSPGRAVELEYRDEVWWSPIQHEAAWASHGYSPQKLCFLGRWCEGVDLGVPYFCTKPHGATSSKVDIWRKWRLKGLQHQHLRTDMTWQLGQHGPGLWLLGLRRTLFGQSCTSCCWFILHHGVEPKCLFCDWMSSQERKKLQ